jgi:hypothetical protein
MGIKKQDFYEGAALYQLARRGVIASVKNIPPLFVLNGTLKVLFKYSTKKRSPWGFTFGVEEQALLESGPDQGQLVAALVCGADGIAALTWDSYRTIARPRSSAIHIACYRRRGEHYEISGPDGVLDGKVAPSRWQRILG